MNEEMSRVELLSQLLDAKSQSSATVMNYYKVLHEYETEDSLTISEMHFLIAIGTGEGLGISEIAKKLCVTQGAVSQTAARLEKKGFIVRSRDPENYRRIIARMTDEGRKIYEDVNAFNKRIHENMDVKYLNGYSDEELMLYRDYEIRMNEIFTQITVNLRRNMEAERNKKA